MYPIFTINKFPLKLHTIHAGRSAGVLSRDEKIAIASSVTVFIVGVGLFTIICLLCGHYHHKRKKLENSENFPEEPFYDSVQPKLKEPKEAELELKTNVAYATSDIIRHY